MFQARRTHPVVYVKRNVFRRETGRQKYLIGLVDGFTLKLIFGFVSMGAILIFYVTDM
jgi:hypothetical protein